MEYVSQMPALINEVSRVLDVDNVSEDTNFGELGIDSLNIVELLLACEKVYQTRFELQNLQIDQYTTIKDLDSMIRETISA